jgi:hypothetical protein
MKTKLLAGLILIVTPLAVGCSNVEKGSGQVLDNANSVVRDTSPKVWTEGAEKGTGRALENAGSAVRSADEKIWTPEESRARRGNQQ